MNSPAIHKTSSIASLMDKTGIIPISPVVKIKISNSSNPEHLIIWFLFIGDAITPDFVNSSCTARNVMMMNAI